MWLPSALLKARNLLKWELVNSTNETNSHDGEDSHEDKGEYEGLVQGQDTAEEAGGCLSPHRHFHFSFVFFLHCLMYLFLYSFMHSCIHAFMH